MNDVIQWYVFALTFENRIVLLSYNFRVVPESVASP